MANRPQRKKPMRKLIIVAIALLFLACPIVNAEDKNITLGIMTVPVDSTELALFDSAALQKALPRCQIHSDFDAK